MLTMKAEEAETDRPGGSPRLHLTSWRRASLSRRRFTRTLSFADLRASVRDCDFRRFCFIAPAVHLSVAKARKVRRESFPVRSWRAIRFMVLLISRA